MKKDSVRFTVCIHKELFENWIMYHNFMDARSRMNFAE